MNDKLTAAGRLLDIPVHDHVSLGRGRYPSMAEAGLPGSVPWRLARGRPRR